MPITLLPSLILFSISKVVAPVASKMDPTYLNLLTAKICPVSVTIPDPGSSVKYSVFPKIEQLKSTIQNMFCSMKIKD
jgi:hypothetical protein